MPSEYSFTAMESEVQGVIFSTEWVIEYHFREHYSIEAIRPVKVEFLKRDLRSLLISPVDLAYYAMIS